MANLSLVAPALIGVSLGRSPSGAVPDIVADYRPLWRVKGVLAAGLPAQVGAYLLVLTKVMGNWWLVLATVVIALVTPAMGQAVRPDAFASVRCLRAGPRTPAGAVTPVDGGARGRGRCPALRSPGSPVLRWGPGAERRVPVGALGGVTGLIGSNGAGKTTLFNVVSGLLARVRAGEDRRSRRHQGGPLGSGPPGPSRTYQRLELFTSLTVRDNIRVAGEIRNTWGRRRGSTSAPRPTARWSSSASKTSPTVR